MQYNIYKEIVSKAIRERKKIVFDYRDDKGKFTQGRIIDPYALIPVGDDQHLNVNAIQTGGPSYSRRTPFWSDFHLNSMSNVICIENQFFDIANDYNEFDDKYKNAIEKVHRG